MIIFTRFRDLPDEQMRHIVEYVEAGKPIIGIRTATHAFNIPAGKTYAKYSWQSKEWDGGFGRQVLGETWINHHGHHGKESTRGVIATGAEDHPIVRGCEDIWVPTDVYTVRLPLPGDSKPLVLGQVLAGMKPTDKPVDGPKNNPMMPIAWIKTYQGAAGADGPGLHDHDGLGQGPAERRPAAAAGQRRLLVRGAGRQDSRRGPTSTWWASTSRRRSASSASRSSGPAVGPRDGVIAGAAFTLSCRVVDKFACNCLSRRDVRQ